MQAQINIKALLSRLDRHFRAKLFATEIASLNADIKDVFFKKGILSACRQDEVDSAVCPLGDHDGDDTIAVNKGPDGVYRGLCKEHGKIVAIPAQQAEWIDFNPTAWARVLRGKCSIKGSVSSTEDVLHVGFIQQGLKKLEVLIVSPACPAAIIDILQPEPGMDMLLCIDLGNRQCKSGKITGHRLAINASEVFSDDMLSLEKSVLSGILVNTTLPGQTIKPETAYIRYSHEGNATQLTVAEYTKESTSSKNRNLDLFIDMDKAQVWCKGKEITRLPSKDEKKKKRPISRHQLRILAHYIKHPGRSIAPRDTEAYGMAYKDTSALSAQQSFSISRSALGLNDIIKMGETVQNKRRYYFDPPPKFKYALLTPIDTPKT